MLERKAYLDLLIKSREKQLIKVVTGVRRCGKSTLLALYIEHLKASGVADEQIIAINLEDLAYEPLLSYQALHQYIRERLCPGRYTYVFIDEVQNCPSFEKAIDSLFIQPQVDIYITGSNAYMLSGELATRLSGRYITIDMLPLSFKEYCAGTREQVKSPQEKLNDYLRFGSFPYLISLAPDLGLMRQYLEGIYNTILIKDVATRAGITDIPLLESIIKCVASSLGSPISTKKISDTIASGGRSISANTVDHYLQALTDSYIFYKADRYDIKGRQYLKTLGKYYLVDTGLCHLLLAGSAQDLGHLLENVVYLELLRRGYRVNIGKLAEKEVDFVAQDHDGLIYIQVAATVLSPETQRRELEPLQKIPDHHPKMLLTLDEVGAGVNHDGIRQENIIQWLLA